MRRRLAWIAAGALPLLIGACSGEGSDGSGEDGPKDEDQPNTPSVVETSGGKDLPPYEARTGTLTVVGSSDAVPVSNRSFTGFREGDSPGDELVRCNFYPDGDTEYPPYLEVLAGIEGNDYFQAQLQLFQIASGESKEFTRVPDDTVENGTQDMIFFASLTHDAELGAYRYWYGVDEYAYPPYGSTCSVEVAVNDDQLIGTAECTELFPIPGSPDFPVTNAPSPQARVTVQFDCPLAERDPGGGIIGSEPDGTCTGAPSACLLQDAFTCSLVVGCTPTGDCGGTARLCEDYPTGELCEYQSGCQWSGFTCGGYPKSCYSLEDDLSCLLQSGCDWDDRCDGQAVTCEAFATQNTCEIQGCIWEAQ